MRITADPPLPLTVFSKELELAIIIGKEAIPEVLVSEGQPAPNRHLILGLVQSVMLAIEERDSDTVVFREGRSIWLCRAGEKKDLSRGLVIGKSWDGQFGVLAPCDWRDARQLARQAGRWFTGTVRLDVP
jgi:hypothetical protein